MALKVAVVGSYNGGVTIQADRLPVMGETLLGHDYVEGPGGKGSNQAIAAARLGAEVHFIGCIGQDHNGDAALALWEAEGIHAYVRRDQNTHTGVGIIFLFPEGDNAIVVAPGANSALAPEDIDLMEEAIADCQVLVLQLEIPVKTALHAAKLAKHHGVKVLLNPAPVQPLPPEAFQLIDVLTPNETEAKVLVGQAPDARISDEDLAHKLLKLGVKTVVMTRGKSGALIARSKTINRVKAPIVKTVDPTGCGDAFNGALAVALAEGKPLVAAAQWACYGGAHCATALEVIPGLASRRQLEALIEEQPYD